MFQIIYSMKHYRAVVGLTESKLPLVFTHQFGLLMSLQPPLTPPVLGEKKKLEDTPKPPAGGVLHLSKSTPYNPPTLGRIGESGGRP